MHPAGSFPENMLCSRFALVSSGIAQCTPERDTTEGRYRPGEGPTWTVSTLAEHAQEGCSAQDETGAIDFSEKKRLELPSAAREALTGIQLECAVSDLHVILWIGQCQQRSAVYTEAINS